MRGSIVAIGALLLAACGGQGAGGNAEVQGNAAADNGAATAAPEAVSSAAPGGGGTVALQAGEWETTVQVMSMNVPGMPRGVAPPMPAAITTRHCLTPEQVARPNADFFAGQAQANGCTYENFSMAGGHLQGTIHCNMQGNRMDMTMDGQFTPTSYEIHQQTQATTSGMSTQTELRVTSRRVGDCSGG